MREIGGFRLSRTKHDKPLGLLDTVLVGLGVTEGLPFGLLGLVDLLLGAVTDEDGLTTPLDDNLFGDRVRYRAARGVSSDSLGMR